MTSIEKNNTLLNDYHQHTIDRMAMGIPPLPLTDEQTLQLIELLKAPPSRKEAELIYLIAYRVPPGVDRAAKVKADFLFNVAKQEIICPLISAIQATKLLGTMLGGYNVNCLIELLDSQKLEIAECAAEGLKKTLLIFDAFSKLEQKMQAGHLLARSIIQSWAAAEWFTCRPKVPEKIRVTVFKVSGETNTDDLSPATEAWSRPDIPLHALSMLKNEREGIEPDEPGKIGPLRLIERLKHDEYPVAYVGDVVGTGSSRKSATNSVIWHTGEDIPFVPNKRYGGICLGGKIAPIFFNTQEDSGALPIEVDVSMLHMGDVIDIFPYDGRIERDGINVATFELKSQVLLDEVRAGGRINLIIGRSLTNKARHALGFGISDVFCPPAAVPESSAGYSLAQKIVGKACGLADGMGIRPGTYCEPHITSVGSQDTTGPMTRDELKDLACLSFSADLVMQSFCHTAAYPKSVDLQTQKELPDFMIQRGGVALRPGDGIIHSWLNRFLLPDTVGTGGDSHTRFPIGISFPAGSGLVAFAAATGSMPLDMPESVLVRFFGEMQPGITLRDLVNAIPLFAIHQGLLTVEKKNKENIFSGRILEIEGLPTLKVEQAFELSDSSAERSAAACSIRLDKEPIIEYLESNIALMQRMIKDGYESEITLKKRIQFMQTWLKKPILFEPDKDAEYAYIINIDLNDIKEPIVACPNDPDDVKTLSEVAGTKIDEVFIGSCMTNVGHFRAAGEIVGNISHQFPVKLWICPPTKMDEDELKKEGYYDCLNHKGARMELPGCSLCMGNQARVNDGATVMSTSTRNFPNRLGQGANVFLGSAELAAICAKLGKIPTLNEYLENIGPLSTQKEQVYRYMNFSKLWNIKN